MDFENGNQYRPAKIITNYNEENSNNFKAKNRSKNLFTNYTLKKCELDNSNLKTESIPNFHYKNNINNIKRIPLLLRRNKTFNYQNMDKIQNNSYINNKYNENYSSNIKANLENINIINNSEKIPDSNTVKYSVTNDGSTVSIYGNKIHGLPIIQGVCCKCINNELINLKTMNKKLTEYNYIQNNNNINDINQENTNQIKKKYLLLKINNNKNELLPRLNTEINLNNKEKESIKEKVIRNFLKKEQYIQNQKAMNYNLKSEVDKYLKNSNKITKFSIPCIGLQKFKNKYLPTKEVYISNLSEQIEEKKLKQKLEKKRDQDEFNIYWNKKIEKEKLEEESKNKIKKQKEIEVYLENKKLEENKKIKKLKDKLNNEKEKEGLEIKKNIKYRIKRNLKEKLDERMKLKRNNSFDFKRLNQNIHDISDINIYSENKINQYGRCLYCHKLFKKNQMCPKREYENIKKEEDKNEQKLYFSSNKEK